MRQCRRFAGVIVPRNQQHPAVSGRASRIGVLKHVARAVNTRPFAVPHPKHAVVLRPGEEPDLLRTPNGGRRKFFIHTRREKNVFFFEEFFRFPQRLVICAEW